MRTLNLFSRLAVIGALLSYVPLAEAQRQPAKKAPAKPAATTTPLTQTLSFNVGNTAVTIGYPDGWSSAQATLNTWVLLNVPLDQQSTATPTIRMYISYLQRVDHNDALNQLQEYVNESPTTPNFLTIGTWTAFQRVQTVQRPQPGEPPEEQEQPDDQQPLIADRQMIQITTAVAADSLLFRIETDLASDADQPTQNLVLQIGQSMTFSSTAPIPQTQLELRRLRNAPRRSPSQQRVAAPQNVAMTLPGAGLIPVAAGGGSSPLSTRLSPLSGRISSPFLVAPGSPVFPLLNLGMVNGELDIAVSNDGKNVVITRANQFIASNDGGQTFPFTSFLPVGDGDGTIAWAQSGNFYGSSLFGGACPANSSCVEIAPSTNNGQSFGTLVNAVVCPNSGGGACSVDQEHIAADRFIAGAGGKDRVYMGLRDCLGGCGSKSFITCSPDSSATWAPLFSLEGGSDFPRVTVGQDGFFYVVYHVGGNIRIDKFNACTTSASQMTRASASFPTTVSSYNDVAGCEVANGFPGLDRCNDGNKLSSWMVAVDDTNANHVYAAWATNTAANNENVQVADSIDGGKTWRPPVIINTGVAARRFMPWVCPSGGNAFVTWYGRDAATAANNDLTDFFAASAGLSGGALVANNDQLKISAASDPQCRIWAAPPRTVFDSENCSVQPELAGQCSITTSQRCDFITNGCPAGETCKTGGGSPKYGDYNANACVQGRLYSTFATGKNTNGTNLGAVTDFFQTFVVGSTPTALIYTGDLADDYHDPATLSALLTLSGTSSGVAGQTITFTLGAQSCAATTNAAGFASCPPLTLTQIPGPYTVNASFAGFGNFQPSSGSSPFIITREETTLSYTGDTVVGNGDTAHLSAVLLEDGVAPIGGRSVSFTIGTGGTAQTCTPSPLTNGAGIAACTIVVNQPGGAQPIAVNFAGDAFYLPSSASATLIVPVPPQITKSFADSQIELFFGFTRLSFTIINPPVNPISLAGIAFTDTLPSGLVLLLPDDVLMGTCGGGTITAVPGTNIISLSGATLPANGSCTFSVLVNGAAIGVQNNVTSSITSTTGGGLVGSPASASVSVPDTQFFWFFAESGGGSGQH
jgi:hypothetical protein